MEALGAGVGRPVPSRAPTGPRLPGAGRGGRRGQGLRPRRRAPVHRALVLAAGPGGTASAGSAPFSSSQAVFYYAPLVHYLWGPELAQKLFEYRWDTNAPRSARAYALVSIAGYDSTIACWDGKFFYWTARPDPV